MRVVRLLCHILTFNRERDPLCQLFVFRMRAKCKVHENIKRKSLTAWKTQSEMRGLILLMSQSSSLSSAEGLGKRRKQLNGHMTSSRFESQLGKKIFF